MRFFDFSLSAKGHLFQQISRKPKSVDKRVYTEFKKSPIRHSFEGSASSSGYFYGPGRRADDTENHSGWAMGGAVGAGAGVFYTNADKWHQLDEGFETTIISAGPFGLEINKSGPIWMVQITLGKSQGGGIAHFKTYTPPELTGTYKGCADDALRKIINGIEDTQGGNDPFDY